MIISKSYEFDSAHQLELPYQSKCSRLHGHRYRVVVYVEGKKNENGMVIDFNKLDNAVKPLIKELDHRLLNDLLQQPTAENLAIYIYEKLVAKLSGGIENKDYKLKKVRVYETPKSFAEYGAIDCRR